MRSECGARARSRKPLPGGSGPPLGRHHDRSPRSSVDSRQATTSNARRAGSQETRELELSQRRMRSPWRMPRRSAERRAARDKSRCRAADELRKFAHTCLRCADMDGAPIGAPPPFFVRMISSETRTPLFGIVRGEASFFVRVVVRKARMRGRIARMILFVSASRAKWRREQSPLIPAKAGIQSGSRLRGDERRNRKGQPHANQISERHAIDAVAADAVPRTPPAARVRDQQCTPSLALTRRSALPSCARLSGSRMLLAAPGANDLRRADAHARSGRSTGEASLDRLHQVRKAGRGFRDDSEKTELMPREPSARRQCRRRLPRPGSCRRLRP